MFFCLWHKNISWRMVTKKLSRPEFFRFNSRQFELAYVLFGFDPSAGSLNSYWCIQNLRIACALLASFRKLGKQKFSLLLPESPKFYQALSVSGLMVKFLYYHNEGTVVFGLWSYTRLVHDVYSHIFQSYDKINYALSNLLKAFLTSV